MSMNNGGPAFPSKRIDKDLSHLKPGEFGLAVDVEVYNSGMTLRDYFAAKIISSLCHPEMLSNCFSEEEVELAILNDTGLAYKIADAMLAARGRHD